MENKTPVMHCRRCTRKAVMYMRQHKLALCAEHFLDWVPEQVERSIERYQMFNRQQRILVAVSGGKDSLSLWDILLRLGYQADGLYIGLGIDEGLAYSSESERMCVQFATERNLRLIKVNVEETYGASIPLLARQETRGRDKPCAVCGLSKRHIMNRVASEEKADVLVTGHNLDDEAAILFGNTLNWLGNYLVRQSPVLEADDVGLVRKAKPLCRMYEREMAAYALLRGIEYIYEECPYSTGSNSIYYKELLNRLEHDKPGAKLSFYLSFLQAKQGGLFAAQANPRAAALHACPSCGQPTGAPGECAFCRMINREGTARSAPESEDPAAQSPSSDAG